MPNTFPYQAVYDACDYPDLDPEEAIREDYSGRGMYGRTCFGIVGSERELFLFVAGLADMACELTLDDTEVCYIHRDDVQRLIQDATTDSMGRDMILYFPSYTLDKS